MTGLVAALAVEGTKVRASPVARWATGLMVVGIVALSGSLTRAAEGGNERVADQLGPLAGAEGWALFLGVAAQVTAAGALLAFGVTLSWMFGREFADDTISALFALPVTRGQIAAAKLAVYGLWVVLVAAVLTASLGAVGWVLGLDQAGQSVLAPLARQVALAVLTGWLALPAALAATLGRGLLPGVAVSVVIVVVTQTAVVAGAGGWFPLAAPALWALEPSTVTLAQLAFSAVVAIGLGCGVVAVWRRLEVS